MQPNGHGPVSAARDALERRRDELAAEVEKLGVAIAALDGLEG